MKKYAYLFVFVFAVYACGSDTTTEADAGDDMVSGTDESTSSERAEKAKKVFYTVPSPYETALIF